MVRTTSKALTCRTCLFWAVLASAAIVSVTSDFFFQPIKPLYFVQKPNGQPQVVVQQRAVRPTAFSSDEQPSASGGPQPIAQGRSDIVSSSEEEQGDETSAEYDDKPNQNRTELPASFEEDVRRNRPAVEPGRRGPLYGDPAVMEEDTEEQDRSRYLWPFSTTVTVSKTKNIPRPHHHHHLSFPPGFPKPPLLPPHLEAHHDSHSEHDLEYEKTRLKYEIYKLKAKKTIAILQNKVELKKILSLLLQQKIKALEWITW